MVRGHIKLADLSLFSIKIFVDDKQTDSREICFNAKFYANEKLLIPDPYSFDWFEEGKWHFGKKGISEFFEEILFKIQPTYKTPANATKEQIELIERTKKYMLNPSDSDKETRIYLIKMLIIYRDYQDIVFERVKELMKQHPGFRSCEVFISYNN